MEQVYNPNVLVIAIAGYCLKYIDDAGQAPKRTSTAKIAYQNEKDAGRINTSELPDNVYVVGFLDFTSGVFKDYGHVFFIKRSGSSIKIYDSEVQSGARKPYGSLKELTSWFGAYNPVYLGWSTNCDGRQYAKLKEDNMAIIQDKENYYQRCNDTHIRFTSETLRRDVFKSFVGKDFLTFVEAVAATKSAQVAQRWQEIGQIADQQQWEQNLGKLKKENDELKKQITSKPVKLSPGTYIV